MTPRRVLHVERIRYSGPVGRPVAAVFLGFRYLPERRLAVADFLSPFGYLPLYFRGLVLERYVLSASTTLAEAGLDGSQVGTPFRVEAARRGRRQGEQECCVATLGDAYSGEQRARALAAILGHGGGVTELSGDPGGPATEQEARELLAGLGDLDDDAPAPPAPPAPPAGDNGADGPGRPAAEPAPKSKVPQRLRDLLSGDS